MGLSRWLDFIADRPQLKRLMKRLGAGNIVKAPVTDRFAWDPTDLLVLGRDIRTFPGSKPDECFQKEQGIIMRRKHGKKPTRSVQ